MAWDAGDGLRSVWREEAGGQAGKWAKGGGETWLCDAIGVLCLSRQEGRLVGVWPHACVIIQRRLYFTLTIIHRQEAIIYAGGRSLMYVTP